MVVTQPVARGLARASGRHARRPGGQRTRPGRAFDAGALAEPAPAARAHRGRARVARSRPRRRERTLEEPRATEITTRTGRGHLRRGRQFAAALDVRAGRRHGARARSSSRPDAGAAMLLSGRGPYGAQIAASRSSTAVESGCPFGRSSTRAPSSRGRILPPWTSPRSFAATRRSTTCQRGRLATVGGSAEIEHFPAGSVILDRPASPPETSMWCARARSSCSTTAAADLLGEGEVFGQFSLLADDEPHARRSAPRRTRSAT